MMNHLEAENIATLVAVVRLLHNKAVKIRFMMVFFIATGSTAVELIYFRVFLS